MASYNMAYINQFTGFKLSWWFTANSNPILRFLHRAEVGWASDISEKHAASIFSVTLYRKNTLRHTQASAVFQDSHEFNMSSLSFLLQEL